METIRISPVRMKIILNEEDRRRFAVTDDAVDGDVRGLLRRSLRDTEEASLLDTAAGQLHLQVYDGRDGGCEIFLTCLAAAETEEAVRTPHYLALWDTEALFTLCRRLKSLGYAGESRLLRLGERWFLSFGQDAPPLAALDFGETVSEDAACYINEYASCLSDSIIALLG